MCGKRYPLKQHVTRHMRKIHAEVAPSKRRRAKPSGFSSGGSSSHDDDGDLPELDGMSDLGDIGDSNLSTPECTLAASPMSRVV